MFRYLKKFRASLKLHVGFLLKIKTLKAILLLNRYQPVVVSLQGFMPEHEDHLSERSKQEAQIVELKTGF